MVDIDVTGNNSANLLLSRTAREMPAPGEESFLRFHLVPDTKALLSISQLSEVLKINARAIVPIPHLPSWAMGVYNWRGEILWMLDLGHLLGLTPWHQQNLGTTLLSAIVINDRARTAAAGGPRRQLGIVVNTVEGMERLNPTSIQSAPGTAVTAELAPFLWGHWIKNAREILVVLDGEAIFDRMPSVDRPESNSSTAERG